MKFPKILEITFRGSHSLIVAHKPENICAEGLCENILSEKTEDSIASFGLFGSSADVNKFYDISSDAWTPKDEDFIEPMFRGLSETIVSWRGMPISFKKPGVLKASLSLARGITINTNHDTETENAVGAVSKTLWQEGYRAKGVTVPAGINLILKIDAKSNPRLARGILMDPPSIHSNSVTVRFEHERSHMEMDADDFWGKLGTHDKNGKLIHIIVTKIVSYKETSLVNHGADPYAQKINEDGEILDPKYASKVYDFSEDNTKSFLNTNKTDMDFLKLLTSLGLTIEEVKDEAALVAHFTAMKDNQLPEGTDLTAMQEGIDELAALKVVNADITPETLTTLTENQLGEDQTVTTPEQTIILEAVEKAGNVATLVAEGKLGKTYLATMRTNAVTQFKLAEGDKANEEIITTIMKSDLKAAKAFEAQYAGLVETKFPLTCKDCNSENVSRGTVNQEEPKKKTTSYTATRDDFAAKSRRAPNAMHEEAAE